MTPTAALNRPPSIWGKALPALPKALAAPHAEASVAYIGQWLAVLADDPDRGGEFDRELEAYAADLRRTGQLTAHQGSGFILALFAYANVGSPLTATLVAQVDRRAALRGIRHCRWRGDLPQHEYDAPRYDDALRRSQLPSKYERGAA